MKQYALNELNIFHENIERLTKVFSETGTRGGKHGLALSFVNYDDDTNEVTRIFSAVNTMRELSGDTLKLDNPPVSDGLDGDTLEEQFAVMSGLIRAAIHDMHLISQKISAHIKDVNNNHTAYLNKVRRTITDVNILLTSIGH